MLQELVESRRSCRAFLPDSVPREVIERMLATAAGTPSWSNTQPWKVFVVSGAAMEALRADLRQVDGPPRPEIPFPESFPDDAQGRRRESGRELYEAVGIALDDREASRLEIRRNFDFFGAPHVAVVTVPAEMGAYAVLDCGLWLQTFLLAAQAEGLASIPQAAPAGRAYVLREHLPIPDGRSILASVAFGWEDATHPTATVRPRRAALSETTVFLD